MLKSKTITLLFMSLILFFSSCFCFSSTASAATSGNKNCKSTITVITKANYWYPGSSSITLKQNKTEFTYTKNGKRKTSKMYAAFRIEYKNCNTGKTKTTWLTGSSKKIKLDKNATYKVTVSYDSTMMQIKNAYKTNFAWKTTPCWWVNSKWKVSKYY